jgi:hypothetical protein
LPHKGEIVNNAFQPTKTFSSIYGGKFIFAARLSPNADHWQTQGVMAQDMMTSGMLTVLGDMSVVCAASVSSPECFGLLRDAGFQLPSDIYRYCDLADYITLIKKICAGGPKIVTQHVHPTTEIPTECSWIAPSVLSFVNNKANLRELVPNEKIPDRDILLTKRLADTCQSLRLPAVIKAVTDESSGGGIDVRICRSITDVQKAVSYFAECRSVIVEEYLHIRRNLCLHYCVTQEGSIAYLGFAKQVIDEDGQYHGNWIDVKEECPIEAIELGTRIALTGFERGYFGVLGIDVAMLEDGTCKAFDLNFRGNGSTPAVLYAQSVYENYHKPVMRFRRFTGRGNYRDMLKIVYRALARGMFLPLGSCDPEAGSYRGERPRLIGLILGATRQNVFENERELVSMGLDI